MFDFPNQINKLEEVPEKYQIFYAEGEEGFQLDDVLSARLSRTDDEAIKRENKTLNHDLADFRSLGQSAEMLKQAMDEMATSHGRLLIEKTAIEALSKTGGNLNLLLPHVKNSLQVVTKDGQQTVQIHPDCEAFDALSQNAAEPSLGDFVSHLQKHPDFAVAFADNSRRGGGMKPGGAPASALRLSSAAQSSINSKLEEIATGKVTVTL